MIGVTESPNVGYEERASFASGPRVGRTERRAIRTAARHSQIRQHV
jgi:hypothetical protein